MRIEEIIEELRRQPGDYFDPAVPPDFELISQTPQRNSRIAFVRARWGNVEKKLFVKILFEDMADGRSNRSDREYKEGQIRTEYSVLKNLHAAFSSSVDLGVVRPVACLPNHLALVTEEQNGGKLLSILRNARIGAGETRLRELARWVSKSGKWLRTFQELTPGDGGKGYDFSELLEYCDVRLERLSRQRPDEISDGFCAELRRRLECESETIRRNGFGTVGCHNDFGPNNMILSGDRFVMLDFSGFSYGPACCDYVKFWSELELMKSSPLNSRKSVARLQSAFFEGYGRNPDFGDPLFRVFRIAYMLDKMDDVWLDWKITPWWRRFAYKRLYSDFLGQIKTYLQ